MSDFNIISSSIISQKFKAENINSFKEACSYIKALPYKRNSNKYDVKCVFIDGFGTCSTKHATLKQLAEENSQTNLKLILGIFRMSKTNMPSIKNCLAKYGLDYIPEAHNFLSCDDQIIDCTKTGFGVDNFKNDLISEIEIETSQITDFKVHYHQQFLNEWLKQESNINFSFDEIWAIREECILALSK